MNTFATKLQSQASGQLAKWLCISLLMQGLAGCKDADKPFPAAGETFPLSALAQTNNISGSEIDFRGKTLLVNFWATWCVPCRNEMPNLQKLSDALDPERFAVIGVSVDEDANLAREFILQYKIRFHNFQDNEFQLASDLLGIETYPQTFIVSPRGIITRRISKIISWDQNIMDLFSEIDDNAAKTAPGYGING